MRNEDSMLQAPLAHHDGSELYVNIMRPELGDIVTVSVRISDKLRVSDVYVRCVIDGEPRYQQAHRIPHKAGESWWSAPITIINALTHYRFLLITPNGNLWLNGGGLHTRDIPDVQDFRLTTHHIPEWAQNAVIYQIFPDRFAPSPAHPIGEYPQWAVPARWDTPVAAGTPDGVRQIYGGSLWGVAEHLSHIKELGANVIYLTPFFPAQSNHRYDASTFERVDPLLGGDEALRRVTHDAHQLDIRVIGDLTLNHSGVTHDWFATGQAHPESPEAGFYYFDPANRQNYAMFDGVASLPKFDHRSPELQRRLYSGTDSVVARYIRDFGLDGWRIDVAQSAGRYHDIDMNHEIAERTRNTMDSIREDTLLVAEHQFDASDTLQGSGWQGTMAYAAFTKPVWAWLSERQGRDHWGMPGEAPRYNADALAGTMGDYMSLIPWQSCLASMNLLDSHDTSRFRSIAGRFQQLGVALLMTMPGMPSVFAGDEVGVNGIGLEEGRKPFPWDRSQWDHELYALYQRLIALRHAHTALQQGGLRWYRHDADSVIFERADSKETLLIEVSKADHTPLISSLNAINLFDKADLVKGEPMPKEGPTFHIWQVTD